MYKNYIHVQMEDKVFRINKKDVSYPFERNIDRRRNRAFKEVSYRKKIR